MKILLVGAEFFLEDGRTDMTKIIISFRNFANMPKSGCINLVGRIYEKILVGN